MHKQKDAKSCENDVDGSSGTSQFKYIRVISILEASWPHDQITREGLLRLTKHLTLL